MTHEHHQHTHAPADFGRAFAIGIVLNFGFVLVEAFYGWQADSLALLADAGHNLSDVLGLLMAWAGFYLARRCPDAKHTYGWGRATILAALFNALILLVVIGGIVWEAVSRFSHPVPVAADTVMLVAAIGVVINGITAWLFMSGSKDDLNLRGAFLSRLGILYRQRRDDRLRRCATPGATARIKGLSLQRQAALGLATDKLRLCHR